MAADEDLLTEARELYKLAIEGDDHNRKEGLDDLKFARLGEQWPLQIRNARERANRPCLTINRLPAFIRQVVNDSRQNKPSIKVHPVDSGADVATAKVLDGLIRNIEQSSNADVAYDTAADFAVTIGFGFWRVGLGYAWDDSFDQDITIDRVGNPFSVYGDPYSTAADSSDWNTAFVTDQMTEEEFQAKYKGAEQASFDAIAYYTDAGPQWFDGEMVTIAEWWRREEIERTLLKLSNGEIIAEDEMKAMQDILDALQIKVVGQRPSKSHKVTQYIISGKEILETNPWAGKYIPIVPVYGDEVNVEGKRYFRSLIRDAKDPQRMHNYWRTTATEMVALQPKAPFIGHEGAFSGEDAAKWDTANTETHSYLSVPDGQDIPQRQQPQQPDVGAMQEALAASDDMKAVMGLYDASLGQRSNETSGKAIIARQREGDVSTFHFIDNVSRAIRHTGRILLDLIPKVYTGERIIRTLGEDGTPSSVQLGQGAPSQPGAPPPPAAGASPVPGQPPAGPIPPAPGAAAGLPAGVERIYDLAAGKYDLTVQAGPSYSTRRLEAADQMMTLIQQYPQAAPVIGDLLVKNLDWPGADEIAERLKAMAPQPHDPNAPPPVDPAAMAKIQADQQAQQAKMQADQQSQQQKLQADMMKTQHDGALAIKLAEMETARAIAVAEIAAKADVQANIHSLVADTVQAAMQAEHAKELQAMQPAEPPAGASQ